MALSLAARRILSPLLWLRRRPRRRPRRAAGSASAATSAATQGLIFPGADLCRQALAAEELGGGEVAIDRWDWRTTAAFLAYGCLVQGPLLHAWGALARSGVPGRAAAAVARKVLLGQLLFAPASLALFFGSTSALQGRTAREGAREIVDKVPQSWMVREMLRITIILYIIFSRSTFSGFCPPVASCAGKKVNFLFSAP